MKIGKKVQFLVILIMFVATGVVYLVLHQIEGQATKFDFHPVPFGELTVGIPWEFGPALTGDRNGWHVSTFKNQGVGTLELATSPASSKDFQKAAIRYFSMKRFPAHTAIYRAKGSFWFAKNMSGAVPGVLVIRTRGKGRVFTYFFSDKNISYWLSFSTGHSLASYAKLFFRMVSSLKADGKPLHGLQFEKDLNSVCREGYFVFCQPILFFLFLPVGIGLLAVLLSGAVSKRLGRLPGLEVLNNLMPVYTEANASVMLRVMGKSQISSLGLVVNNNGIQLFQFGRLFIDIPRKACGHWEVSEGRGWFGGPYVQIIAPADELVKSKQRFIRYTGKMTVRIYSNQPGMLHQYLA